MLRRLGRRAGVHKVHAHRFRHTFATWAIEHDAREFDVQYPWAGCITSTSVSPRDIRADDIFW